MSIIIPSKNRLDSLQTCIASIERHTDDYEIIVVDNDSDESVIQWLQGHDLYKDNTLKIIPFPGQFNYSAAINLGARYSTAPFIAILNNDTTVCDGWVEEAISVFCLHGNIGQVGFAIWYPDETLQSLGARLAKNGGSISNGRLRGQDYIEQMDRMCNGILRCHYNAMGVVSRDVFEAMSGFDESYRLYCSDADFGIRLAVSGLQVVASTYAKIYHHMDTSERDSDYNEASALLIDRWHDWLKENGS